MLTIALVNPQIPPNTGNIARTCAATKTRLHLVGKPGFMLDETSLKRAGLDYWHLLDVDVFPDIEAYFSSCDPKKLCLLSSKVAKPYTQCPFEDGYTLVFGSETTGIDPIYMERFKLQSYTIPMWSQKDGMRCLNLATSVGIVLYQALQSVRSDSF